MNIYFCPRCYSSAIRKHGLTKRGTPRYKCIDCFKTFTGTKLGRPPQGIRAMTNAERQKKHRNKKRIKLSHT